MTLDNNGLLHSILKDIKIQEKKKEECLGLEYQTWIVEPRIWSDQIQTLLENGFMVSIDGLVVTISKQLPSSPDQIRTNKQVWKEIGDALNV